MRLPDMSRLHLLPTLALLVGCLGPELPGAEHEDLGESTLAGGRLQGGRLQGGRLQGASLGGQEITSYDLSGMRLLGQPLKRSWVERGELVGELVADPRGASLEPCSAPAEGVTRRCGFQLGAFGQCTPGLKVQVGAGACRLGASKGDTVMRICEGGGSCEPGTARVLGQGDDACGSKAPLVQFTCPTGGRFTVMTGSKQSAETTSSVPAARELVADLGIWVDRRVVPFVVRGADFAGATLRGTTESGTVVQLRIEKVAPELPQYDATYDRAASGHTFLYTLEHRVPETGAWTRVCETDPDGVSAAIPLEALWDATGAREVVHGKFTFGCTTGVAAKCYRWGYRPWYTPPGQASGYMEDAHWTCTRLARADYCGDGRSHTMNGTLIDLWDILKAPTEPVQIRDEAFDRQHGLLFEAGWSTSGARCLSHARWNTLPPDLCPNLDPTDNVCDTEAEAIRRFRVKHFNSSKYNVAP